MWSDEVQDDFLGADIAFIQAQSVMDKPINNPVPKLVEFDMKNIDTMKMNIMKEVDAVNAYTIDYNTLAPYGLPLSVTDVAGKVVASTTYAQEGLCVKTYQADLFNNWLNTANIVEVTDKSKVSTVGGFFSINQLNIKSKLWKMLNAINVSGGSYDDYIDAVYDVDMTNNSNIPQYEGGLIHELAFDEVVSTAQAGDEALGTLAGRGKMMQGKQGGKVVIKTKEHSYIIGIASITPRVDYSQGNAWHGNILNMDQWHKPDLDQIGFEDLITDKMAFFDTKCTEDGVITYKSAGKVPAWSNYHTAVNKVSGNFAIEDDQMWMVNNRNYKPSSTEGIADLTTYIDPMKFNHIFANTRRDAMNYWMQIAVDWTARRKMSSKVIPKLS